MWLEVGFVPLIFALIASARQQHPAGGHADIQCVDVNCKHDEVCKLSNHQGHLSGECIRHWHGIPAIGCPPTLADNQSCYCTTTACADAIHIGPGAVLPHLAHRFTCGGHECHHEQVCVHDRHKDGVLHSNCMNKAEIHHDHHHITECINIPTEHHPCYCGTEQCNTLLLQKIFQQTHNPQVAVNHEFVCGDHICHGHQKCVIEQDHHDLHLHCEDHIPPHTTHCLPTLVTPGHGCFCETRNCVDQTLISLFKGHKVSGLICSEKDNHVCAPYEVCVIGHEKHAHFTKECRLFNSLQECTRLPSVGYRCYCSTQDCVYGYFTAHTTTTAPAPTTQTQSTQAPTQTKIPITAAPSSLSVTTSTITPVITNSPTSSVATNAPATQTVTTSTCKDDEDANFNCISYDIIYNICSVTTGSLYDIALKRCRSFCGYCNRTSSVVTTPSTLQVLCVDHDPRCQQHAQQICSSSIAQKDIISTCAKTCNKCSEYFALLQTFTTATPSSTSKVTTTTSIPITTTTSPNRTTSVPVPTTANGPQCYTCGDFSLLIPCAKNEVFGNGTRVVCPQGKEYCMSDVYVDTQGNKDVFKRCVSKQTCQTRWVAESSGKSLCTQFGAASNANSFECHFCCQGDFCNTNIKPPDATLV